MGFRGPARSTPPHQAPGTHRAPVSPHASMGLLTYTSLGVAYPEALLRRAYDGLRDFYEYLSKTRNYLQSDAAVLRLGWRASGSGSPSSDTRAVAVELREPPDRPDAPQATFDAF